MKSNIIALSVCWLVSAFAFGCGDSAEWAEQGEGADLVELELAEIEQPIAANSSKAGISTASSHQTCRSDGPAGQDCLVPAQKTIVYCYSNAGGTWSDSEISNLEGFGVGAIAGDFPGFNFSRLYTNSQQSSCANDGTVNKVRKGTCPGGSTGSNVENFVCYSPTVTGSALTESLPGTWRKMLGGTITVDLSDINLFDVPGTTDEAPGRNCLRAFGLSHSLAAAAGFGSDSSITDQLSQLHTTRRVNPVWVSGLGCQHQSASSQEQCFALAYSTGGGNTMSFNTAVCNP